MQFDTRINNRFMVSLEIFNSRVPNFTREQGKQKKNVTLLKAISRERAHKIESGMRARNVCTF